MGGGALPSTLDVASLERVVGWIMDLPAPAYPDDKIDHALAAQGETIYQEQCASCHALDGSQIGQVEPIAEIQTDPQRLRFLFRGSCRRHEYSRHGLSLEVLKLQEDRWLCQYAVGRHLAARTLFAQWLVPTLRALLDAPEDRQQAFIAAMTSMTGKRWLCLGCCGRGRSPLFPLRHYPSWQ